MELFFHVDCSFYDVNVKFNLTPKWCASKNGTDHSLTSSKKVDAVTNMKTANGYEGSPNEIGLCPRFIG